MGRIVRIAWVVALTWWGAVAAQGAVGDADRAPLLGVRELASGLSARLAEHQ